MPTLSFFLMYDGTCRRLETDIDGNVVDFPYRMDDAVPCRQPDKHPHRGDPKKQKKKKKKWPGYGRAMDFDRRRFRRRLRALIRDQYGHGLLSLGGLADAVFECSERRALVKLLGDLMGERRPEPAMLRPQKKKRTRGGT